MSFVIQEQINIYIIIRLSFTDELPPKSKHQAEQLKQFNMETKGLKGTNIKHMHCILLNLWRRDYGQSGRLWVLNKYF